MVVLDASVVVDLVLGQEPSGAPLAARVRSEAPHLYAPYLLDAEVGQALRRFVLHREITRPRALAALEDFSDLPIQRHVHAPLLRRAFELHRNATFYDALYIALAEGLGAPLLTRDAALAKIPGARARIEIL